MIIKTIAESVWCNMKVPHVKSVELYIKKHYSSLKNKAQKKLVFTSLMCFEALFLEMITFEMQSVCREVIEKLPKLKYVNGTFIH